VVTVDKERAPLAPASVTQLDGGHLFLELPDVSARLAQQLSGWLASAR
jgi:hypothetical protein